MVSVYEPWFRILKIVEAIEEEHHKLPQIYVAGDGPAPNMMMERTTCIQKHIATKVSVGAIDIIVSDTHVTNEIKLLRRDMETIVWAIDNWRIEPNSVNSWRRISQEEKEKWRNLGESVKKLEAAHHKLPETPVGEIGFTVKMMLERTTCIQKEIIKMVRQDLIKYLAYNQHINEEIELLEKDLRILKEELGR